MSFTARFAALAAVIAAFAAPVAAAEDCESVLLPRALQTVQTVSTPGADLVALITRMDAAVKNCPSHPWINVLGAQLDLVTFTTLRTNNGGVANQDAVNYLARAFERSNVFYQVSEDERRGRYEVVGLNGYRRIDYAVASDIRKGVVEALAGLAQAGTVHPYFTPKEPLVCEGWLPTDTQKIAYMVQGPEDTVLLGFFEAAADACRTAPYQSDRVPLSILARANIRLVEKEQVKDPAAIRHLLTQARRAADDFMGTTGYHTLLWSETYDEAKLRPLLRKYGIHFGDGPETIDQSLWFTKEYIGSEVALRSMAYAFSGYWSPLAAGEAGGSNEEVAKARNQFSAYLLQLKKQGKEGGLEAESIAAIKQALAAFNSGEIRPAEALYRKPIPQWLMNVLNNVLSPPETTAAQ